MPSCRCGSDMRYVPPEGGYPAAWECLECGYWEWEESEMGAYVHDIVGLILLAGFTEGEL